MNRADQPIGVLDSGLGGLAVVRALRRLLPGESIVYLGDTARGPYEDKAPATLERFTLETAAGLARHSPKLMVLTCAASAAQALGAVQAAANCPVIGIIEPGAQAAAEVSGPVGIIGAGSAIRSGAFEAAVRRRKPKAVIHALACPLLGDLAEEGWLEDPITDSICRRYLNQIPFAVHTVLLGSTRYSALLPSLGRVRANTRWLDAAELTAQAVEQLLRGGLGFRTASARGDLRILLTDLTERCMTAGERFLGEPLARVEATTP